jgi:toxin-antitoxin system PIN domain toxin
MRPALLDINVLLALAWPAHIHHEAAHRWFATHRRKGWATCPHTQAGFLRLSMQPAVVKTAISFGDALRVLTSSMSAPEHQFWPQNYSVREIHPEVLSRCAGHHQLADAMLLDLAIRRKGTLATFDRRIHRLLSQDSKLEQHVDLIEA